MQTPFPCVRCGLCCRNIGKVEQLQNVDDGSGTCVHLQSDNLCGIYVERPLWCNVAEAFNNVFRQIMSEHEFIVRNLEICIELNRKAGNNDNCTALSNALSILINYS